MVWKRNLKRDGEKFYLKMKIIWVKINLRILIIYIDCLLSYFIIVLYICIPSNYFYYDIIFKIYINSLIQVYLIT